MISFPTTLPLDCITLMITDMKEKKVSADLYNFATALWNTAGFGLEKTIAKPGNVVGCADDEECDCDIEEKDVDDLMAHLVGMKGELEHHSTVLHGRFGAGPNEDAFNPAILISLIPIVLKLLQTLKDLGIFKK